MCQLDDKLAKKWQLVIMLIANPNLLQQGGRNTLGEEIFNIATAI